MRVHRSLDGLDPAFTGGVVAIGNFDGMHLGHRAVIGEAGRIAHADGLPWVVLTFEPHPRGVFRPEILPFRITPFPVKAREVEVMGVDALVVLEFTIPFSRQPAESFVQDVLVERLGARHVVSGYDFVFGRGRRGDCALLLTMGKDAGFDFTAVSPVHDADGLVLSSTRVREALGAGDPRGAARILGRPFEIEGEVQAGDRRGRTIGFPTANVALGEYVRPAAGVYLVEARIEGESGWRPGVANLGRRPTVGAGEDLLLEVHLLDFEGELYGRRLRVRLLEYLRAEKKFDGLDALRAQIALDAAEARRMLAVRPGRAREGAPAR